LERLNKYASCSPECFVLALVYIDRLIQKNTLLLTSLNVHRIIITSLMLAAKFFDDAYFNNAYYAKVGGVPTVEINALELEFLFSINFSLHVSTDVFERYFAELTAHMSCNTLANSGTQSNPTCNCHEELPAMTYSNEEIQGTYGMKLPKDLPSAAINTTENDTVILED
jgi:Cyclin